MEVKEKEEAGDMLPAKPKSPYTKSRLAELSLIADTGGSYSGEKLNNETNIRMEGKNARVESGLTADKKELNINDLIKQNIQLE